MNFAKAELSIYCTKKINDIEMKKCDYYEQRSCGLIMCYHYNRGKCRCKEARKEALIQFEAETQNEHQ